MTKVISIVDVKFNQRPVNGEFEARMRRMLVDRAATIEQVQPGYWREIAGQGEACIVQLGSRSRRIAPII